MPRFALFTIGTPAATDLLKIVDREDIKPYASDTGFVVDVGEEPDPPFTDEPTGWQAPHTLCFAFTGHPYCVDASTGEPDPAEDRRCSGCANAMRDPVRQACHPLRCDAA